MTDEIEELRRLAMAATPGPWFAHGPINANRRDYGVTAVQPYDPAVGARRRIAWVGNASAPAASGQQKQVAEANAAFIAAANPAAILRLLDTWEADRKGREEAEALSRAVQIACDRQSNEDHGRVLAAERQRDEALKILHDTMKLQHETAELYQAAKRIEKVKSERDDALAKLARAEEALRPFAGLAKQYDGRVFPDDKDSQMVGVCLGDLRRARAALAPQNGEGGNNG